MLKYFNSLKKIFPIQQGISLNFISLQSIIQKPQIINNTILPLVQKQSKNVVNCVINAHHSTVCQNSVEQILKKFSKHLTNNINKINKQITMFYPKHSLFYQISNDSKNLNLLLGEVPTIQNKQYQKQQLYIHNQYIPLNKIITLQQLCAIFPQKVPLSLRKHPQKSFIQKLQSRLKIQLNQQPKFSDILVSGTPMKKWDQAIQVILDQKSCNIHLWYPKKKNKNEQKYKLNELDFLNALQATHKFVNNEKLENKCNLKKYHINSIIQKIINTLKQDIKLNKIFIQQLNMQIWQKQLIKQNFKNIEFEFY